MRLETDDMSLLTDVVKDKTRGDLYTDPEVSVPSRMPRVLALTRDGGQQPQEWRTRTLETRLMPYYVRSDFQQSSLQVYSEENII